MCLAFPVDRVFSVFNSFVRASSVFSCSFLERFSCSCVERFQLLVCRVLSVAHVSSAFRCSCVECFQLFVCRAFSVARVLSVFSCSCVARFQLLVCRVLSADRMSNAFSWYLCVSRVSNVFSCSCVVCFRFSGFGRFRLLGRLVFSVARVSSVFNVGVKFLRVGCSFRSRLGRLGRS